VSKLSPWRSPSLHHGRAFVFYSNIVLDSAHATAIKAVRLSFWYGQRPTFPTAA
jgi:hypothetical protein